MLPVSRGSHSDAVLEQEDVQRKTDIIQLRGYRCPGYTHTVLNMYLKI